MTKKLSTEIERTNEGANAGAQVLITERQKKTVRRKFAGPHAAAATTPPAIPVVATCAVLPPPRETKSLALRRSLRNPGGATLTVLMTTTGWQPHTVRAALSGLRKKGWVITRRREATDTIYAIDPEAPVPSSEIGAVHILDKSPSPPEVASDYADTLSATDGDI